MQNCRLATFLLFIRGIHGSQFGLWSAQTILVSGSQGFDGTLDF